MTPNAQFTPPETLASALGPFAKGFGLNRTGATFTLLQLVGVVTGGSIRTTSPEMVICTPAFDLAMIHGSRAMVHGATLTALEGARQSIVEAASNQNATSLRELVESRDRLAQRNSELAAELEAHEARWSELTRAKPPGSLRYGMADLGQQMEAAETKEWPEIRDRLLQEREEIQRRLVDIGIALAPGVILDGGDWREFVDAGGHTFDGHFLQITNATALIGETALRSNRLLECAELLRRSRNETLLGFSGSDRGFRAAVNLSGMIEEFGTLLQHPRIKKTGLLDSFVFCEGEANESPDVDQWAAFNEHPWHDFMARQLRLRAGGQQKDLALDREGVKTYLDFREWCGALNSQRPVEMRPHFLRWPELMLRLATSLAVIAGAAEGDVLEAPFLVSAGALLREHVEDQAAILGHLQGKRASSQATREEEVEKLVRLLQAKGPLTRRELARSIHGQDYNVIDARLFEAIRRGLVIQNDGRFHAANVSVNASTQPSATENEGGVAA